MQVTTTVEFPGWDDGSVEEAIIRQAADDILKQAGVSITESAGKAVMAEIRSRVGRIVTEAIATPTRRTNRYGEARGEPVTLREVIAKSATEWLETGVNPQDGKPSTYHRDNPVSRAHYLTRIAVRREMEKTYKDAINAAAIEAKAEMDEKVTDLVRESIKRILNI